MAMFTEVKKLQTFVAIVEEGSFTGAAEKLHIAQPWVSVQLKQLEEMLGLTLMERQKGKLLRLTAHGREFLEIARKMLAACSEATGEFTALRNKDRKHLVVGVDPITLYMPGRNELITGFMERHRDIELQIVSRTPSELFAGLRNLEFDLILTSHPDPAEEVETLPLYQYELRLMVPKASADRYDTSRRGGLAGAQILTLPDSYHPGLYDWLRSTVGPLGVKWMQCPEDSFPALIRYAAMLGVAVLAPDFGERSPVAQSEMEVRRLGAAPLTVRWSLMRRTGFCKTAAEAFWRMAIPRAIGEAGDHVTRRAELIDA
jgi:DNA-binding transcriptional LysR family regulator